VTDRGYFGIGIEHGKTVANLGTLFRSAQVLGADFVFTVFARYNPHCSDTMKSWRHIPCWHFPDLAALKSSNPRECLIVGVELMAEAQPLASFRHPERAIYLLGAEDHGLTRSALSICHKLVSLPGERSLNVAACGTVVLYDRIAKRGAA
jgi:tRNA G18 (ribose-2'-O)-methylase SpoU